jgi:hypothetical protein
LDDCDILALGKVIFFCKKYPALSGYLTVVVGPTFHRIPA